MEKDSYEFIAKRCEEALLSDPDYINEEQRPNPDCDILQSMAEIICYTKGYADAMATQKCS